MKNMLFAGSPRWLITWPALTDRPRSSRAISAMSAARRSWNNGTRATMPQVTAKSREWISRANAVATMPTGRASNP